MIDDDFVGKKILTPLVWIFCAFLLCMMSNWNALIIFPIFAACYVWIRRKTVLRWFGKLDTWLWTPSFADPNKKTQEQLLLKENAYLKLQNAELLKKVGQQSEYR